MLISRGPYQLPPSFARAVPNLPYADLLIVMGTSLTVHPFASLAGRVGPYCPRVLINLERVGNFGSRPDDLVLLGACDDIVRDICRELGWEEELDGLWQKTEASVLTQPMREPKAEKEEKLKDTEEGPSDLEAVEAQLSQLSVSNEKGDEVPSQVPEGVVTSNTATAAMMAQKVAREVSSVMKETSEEESKPKVESSAEEGKL